MNYLHKCLRYIKELAFCLRVGVTVRDKLVLCWQTLRFHVNKRYGRVPHEIVANIRMNRLVANIKLRDSCGDVFIFHEVLGDRVYHVKSDWIRNEPKTIVDLGGNIGMATLAFAEQFPNAKLISVEPHPDSARLLRHNLASLGERATVLESAVSDRAGKMRLSVAAEAYNASLVRESSDGIEVDVVTMDDILNQEQLQRIDILKIDIEGAEKMLLAHSPAWLRKVDLLLIELHNGYGFDELRRDLEPVGFAVYAEGVAHGVAIRNS